MSVTYLETGEKKEDFKLAHGDELRVTGGTATRGLLYGTLKVSDGGLASACQVSGYYVASLGISIGGGMEVCEGGLAVGTIVQGQVDGEYFSFQTSLFNGTLTVSGGMAKDTVVESFGTMTVTGGTADGVTLENKATLTIGDGATLTGGLSFANGSKVTFEEGGILDFDVSRHTSTGQPLVEGFARIQNLSQADITITVLPEQEYASYCLADKVASFSQTVTVQTADAFLGSLALGEKLTAGNNVYSLYVKENSLWLDISRVVRDFYLTSLPEDNSYLLEISVEASGYDLVLKNEEASLAITVESRETRFRNLPTGEYSLSCNGKDIPEGMTSQNDGIHLVESKEESGTDILFASVSGIWSGSYYARHLGNSSGGQATLDTVALAGKNRICDVFSCGEASNFLFLTDDAWGDALFADDVYSAFPDGADAPTNRLCRIDRIFAGDGDDLIDMTSQRFALEQGSAFHGGAGNDTIWAGSGNNLLFGDAGDDRLVGAAGNDVLAGGLGNDSMQGGGGTDIFTFGNFAWGQDCIRQVADGEIVLWFDGLERRDLSLESNENGEAVFCHGTDSITLESIRYSDIQENWENGAVSLADGCSLKFGDDGDQQYQELAVVGAFQQETSKRIF